MKKPRAFVSDHAVVRYLERVVGIDVERFRREIGHRVDRAVEMGASGCVVGGYEYRLKDGHVTTVVEATRPDLRCGRQRRIPDE